MYKFLKPLGASLVAFLFAFMTVFPSFAFVASPSNASPSNALPDNFDLDVADSDYLEPDFDDAFLIDALTVDSGPSGINVSADVVNSSGKWVTTITATYKGSNSNFYQYSWPVLTNGNRYNNICITVPKKYLPSPGNYGLVSTVSPFNLGLDISSAGSRVDAYKSGVLQSSARGALSYSNYSATGNVSIGYNTSLVMVVFQLKSPVDALDVQISKKTPCSFTFQNQAGNTVVSPDVANGSSNSGDVTASNTSQIAQNTASMNDTLKEIVQTISKQLEALWDQMYNYIHLEDMANADKNADKIVDALQNGLTVEVENDDRNTETIVNGYDKSTIDKSNSDLSDSLSGYESAESAASDDAMGYIKDFKYPDLESELGKTHAADCIGIIADIMQKTFVAMGALNLPITVGFTLIFVTMLLGYHRFRN